VTLVAQGYTGTPPPTSAPEIAAERFATLQPAQTLSTARAGAGETRALAPALPALVELVAHPEARVAGAAAGALAALLALWPADTAAALLAADNLALLGARPLATLCAANHGSVCSCAACQHSRKAVLLKPACVPRPCLPTTRRPEPSARKSG
jgi:hypothetical protein